MSAERSTSSGKISSRVKIGLSSGGKIGYSTHAGGKGTISNYGNSCDDTANYMDGSEDDEDEVSEEDIEEISVNRPSSPNLGDVDESNILSKRKRRCTRRK